MNDSLSIVVSVCNAEATLAGQVARLLEVLSDLTSRLEIVLVDDASSDQTLEVARELAAEYPQLRLVRHRDRRGAAAAVRTGLQWARGGTVLVPADPGVLSASELRRLWSLREKAELVVAPGASSRVFDEQLLRRLAESKSAASKATGIRAGGIHMLRRAAALRLLADESQDDPIATEAAAPLQARADAPHRSAGAHRAATFVRHLRNLALGK